MPNVHTFASTGEAYDASQCDDDINDSDVLVVPSEGVVGVLCQAWPVAVTPEHGEFHALREGVTWAEHEGGKYAESARLAQEQAAR